MFFKLVCLCSVAASVLAAPSGDVPLEKQQPTVIPIVSQSEELEANGTYKYSYETANGIKREETSYDKILPKTEGRSAVSGEGGSGEESNEIHVQQGSYSYTAPDGTVITVRYIADENGFRAIGDHIPTVPTLTQQVQARYNEKSGRSLNADNTESESAPVAAAVEKPKTAPASVKPEAPAKIEARVGSATAPQKSASETAPSTAAAEPAVTSAASTPVSEQTTTESATAAASEESSSEASLAASTSAQEEPESKATSAAASKESTSEAASTSAEASSTAAQSSSEASTTEAASPTTAAA